MRRMWVTGAAVVLCLLVGGTVAAQSPSLGASPASGTGPPVALDGSPSASAATREPVASKGCGTSTANTGMTSASMEMGDLTRSWLLKVPPAYDGLTPTPLVVLLHGYAEGMYGVLTDSGMGTLGDEMSYVTVIPRGRGSMERWIWELDAAPMDISATNPDIAFITALLDRLDEELCIDLVRVYVVGPSNGALATAAVGCALEDRIAAIAEVAGVFDFAERCVLDRPVPFIGFQGTADASLLYEGGLGPVTLGMPTDIGVPFTKLPAAGDPVWAGPMPARVDAIAVRNGCSLAPVTTAIAGHVDAMTWPCPPGADVQFIIVKGGGHNWPGSAAMPGANMEIDASRMIWDFFVEHPLPQG